MKEIKAQTEISSSETLSFLTGTKESTLLKLAELNPRSAIIEAWRGIEFAASQVASSRGLQLPSRKDAESPNAVIRAIIKANLLNERDISLYYDLKGLRNQAAHGVDFAASLESVLDYLQLAAQLQSTLERLARNQAG